VLALAKKIGRHKLIRFSGVALILMVALSLKPEVWYLWGILAFIAARWGGGESNHRKALIAKLDQAKETYMQLSKRWDQEAAPKDFEAQLKKLDQFRDELVALPSARQRRYAALVASREAFALRAFLDRFDIEKASLIGIGPTKKSMLESYGIETAGDVTLEAVLAVPGFGPTFATRLMGWRKGIEQQFRFDPQTGVDPRLVADLDREILQKKVELEKSLRQGPQELHRLRSEILARRAPLEQALRVAATELAQATANKAAFS
jgi:DNA-binding helix-hairpin-helix protein with protein kinase domain